MISKFVLQAGSYQGKLKRATFQPVLAYGQVLLVFIILLFFLRLILVLQNISLLESASALDIAQGFWIGTRFDARMAVYAVFPVIFIGVFPFPLFRYICLTWLTLFVGFYLLLGMIEFEFYGEFQQRLNILVVQYLEEDLVTVTGMIWNGFSVMWYLISWLVLSGIFFLCFKRLLIKQMAVSQPWIALPLVVLMLISGVSLARGTMKSGPPLRWGDAYQSENMFVNHIGLNGSFTFLKALLDRYSDGQNLKWQNALPGSEAVEITRKLLLTKSETIADEHSQGVRRWKSGGSANRILADRKLNVVIILMESFSGQYVGALGNESGVTPEFDRLSKKGVLLTRAFSNGTHTHQGIFATLGCFPNLPGYEYLMQQPEGMNDFSSLTSLVPTYQSSFVYNGDFRWDNQNGFFKNQGMDTFIGRDDYLNPVISDGGWGVSDEDMFNRAVLELDRRSTEGNFLVYLQSLSNHIPYNIPSHDSFVPITDEPEISDRLTAMKYSDWALGQFFRHIEDRPYYKDTIFVVLGDHGFGTDNQLTEINLLRFHVPVLIIAPGLKPAVYTKIASQLDVVPTILGLMNNQVRHQCWGRDLFDLPNEDEGFAIIKPSGNEPTMAILRGEHILTFDHERGAHLYNLQMYPEPKVKLIDDLQQSAKLRRQLEAFVQTALLNLGANTVGP